MLASRGCPEFCTYCPHRILASHRTRTPSRTSSTSSNTSPASSIIRTWSSAIRCSPTTAITASRCATRSAPAVCRSASSARPGSIASTSALIDALHRAGLAAISFGVETVSVETLKRAGRRPIPPEHQRQIIADCRRRGIVTAAFYVFGFLQDDWQSIAATIDYAIDMGSTVAQFKLLTPYPGTPMWRQLAPRIYETDWERFDGYTPTFTHPSLTADELSFLLGAAYTRFYMRPSCVATYFRVPDHGARRRLAVRSAGGSAWHERSERAMMTRAVTC